MAPIPGKAVIGIEVPNAVREMVRFKEIVVSGAFEKSKSKLTLCLGKDIVGNPFVAELERMPHLLIAGATGAGKSVALNTMICSLLYKAGPDEVKLIMVDPKRIELSNYDGIPHLITPVVTDVKKPPMHFSGPCVKWRDATNLLSENKARNIVQYNRKIEPEKAESTDGDAPERLPFIVIIIDELADLMMVASRDVEVALTRLAQMARAAGIHLILATQRPSVDVLTGIIKANFPTRLSFQVSSKTDSRTIIDTNGAENLLGNGDMLFMPPGTAKLQRIHGAYISETELARITDYLEEPEKTGIRRRGHRDRQSRNGRGREHGGRRKIRRGRGPGYTHPPGLYLDGSAPSSYRLQPCGADHRDDGERRGRGAVRRCQAPGSAGWKLRQYELVSVHKWPFFPESRLWRDFPRVLILNHATPAVKTLVRSPL